MFSDLEGQSKTILNSCIEMSYFMRGAIQYKDFMELSFRERDLIAKFLEKRMKLEGQRTNPVY